MGSSISSAKSPSSTPFVEKRKSVLLLSISEAGHSNSIIALALELLTHKYVDVHLASFPILRQRAEELTNSTNVVEKKHPSSTFRFHPVDGMSLGEAVQAKGFTGALFPHPTLATSHGKGITDLATLITSWSGAEYIKIVNSCKSIISWINPDVVVVDSYFSAACEACWSLNKKYILSTPSAPLDVARDLQPLWKRLFYYPFFGSGRSFPIPWLYIPKNVMLYLASNWRLYNDPNIKGLIKYRNSHGLPGELPTVELLVARSAYAFCFSLRQLDFPAPLPPKVGLYGPVLLDSIPLLPEDELSQWLDGGRTIMMCLGTHFHYSETQIRNVIRAFRAGMIPTDQVLWKIWNKGKFQDIIDEELENESLRERFRIVEWIDADPGEVMKHKNVVTYVHHGGANSYHEAALAGIPQIILAHEWLDLYDTAVRAEYVGIGIYGNRNAAPDIDAAEFGAAISRLLSPSEEAAKFALNARQVRELCRAAPGKKHAAARVLGMAGSWYYPAF